MFLYQSTDLSPLWSRSFAFKILLSCRLVVASLPCEWRWAIRLSAAHVVAHACSTGSPLRRSYKCCFGGQILKTEVLVRSTLQPPGLDQGKLTTLRCENRKIRHESDIRSIEWYQKNVLISRDYTFK
jgi:hypothetical protein